MLSCPLTSETRDDLSVKRVEDSVEVSLPMGMLDHWDIISEISCSVTSGGGLGVVMELKEYSICTAASTLSSR